MVRHLSINITTRFCWCWQSRFRGMVSVSNWIHWTDWSVRVHQLVSRRQFFHSWHRNYRQSSTCPQFRTSAHRHSWSDEPIGPDRTRTEYYQETRNRSTLELPNEDEKIIHVLEDDSTYMGGTKINELAWEKIYYHYGVKNDPADYFWWKYQKYNVPCLFASLHPYRELSSLWTQLYHWNPFMDPYPQI